MRVRGERVGADSRTFAAINRILPYAPFLLGPAHRLFSQLMPAHGHARWSHEIFPSPRPIRFNEMEYAVPYARGADCVREIVATIRKKHINTGFPLEFRSVAPDDAWLSPFYLRESATIAVHQYFTVDPARLFDACEGIFRAYDGRPHWGKRHTRTAEELRQIYPAYDRFVALRRTLDPSGKFLNPHLRGDVAVSTAWRKKHVGAPVWQAGPVCSTLIKTVSASQSTHASTSRCVCPEVAPLRHNSLRARDQ